MKKLLILFSILVSLYAKAQVDTIQVPIIDSSQLYDTIQLQKQYVDYITGVVGEQPGADYFKFYNQLVEQNRADTSTSPTRWYTFEAAGNFTLNVYKRCSVIKEGVGSKINNEIKDALLPYIKNPWLLRQLSEYNEQLNTELEQIKQRGRDIQKAYQ